VTTRILITGSRYFDSRHVVWDALDAAFDEFGQLIVVNGIAPGADSLAHQWAHLDERGCVPEHHPADWAGLGRRAGFVRNAEMVALGAEVCLAFLADGEENKGTRMTMGLADKAGIPVRAFTGRATSKERAYRFQP